MNRFSLWLARKWVRTYDADLAQAYQVTFSTMYGQQVLQHLLDNIYCKVYEGIDPIAAVTHNARRSVVQEILENIDVAEHPERYRVQTVDQLKESLR